MRVINKHLGVSYTPEQIKEMLTLYETEVVRDKSNEVTSAQVVAIGKKDVVLDLGLKSDATVARSELKELTQLKIGDMVEVYVVQQEDRYGRLIVSYKDAQKIKSLKKIQEAYLNQSTLEAHVISTSKGGLLVMIDQAEAFMPGSQVDIAPVSNFEEFLDKKIDVLVLKINYDKDNIVVSHRALIEKDLEKQRKEVIGNLEKGQILEGVVRNVTSFGAFVDIGGFVGLVYVKHMVWDKRIDHPAKVKDEHGEPVFQRDKKIKVVVTDFDEAKTRISLSTRELLPNPWEKLPADIQEGSTIKGVISKILERGVFVKVANLVEAFMYIADLSHSHYIGHPSEVVSIDQEVEVKVLTLNKEEQEFRVGIKQLTPAPFGTAEFFKKYGLNTKHEGIVRRFVEQGAFVEVEPGVEAFLHTRHMSWTRKIKHPSQCLKKGEPITFLVLNVDEERKLLEAGLRELEDSPWEKFETIFAPGTVHEGTIVKLLSKDGAAIVQLPYGLECKVEKEHLIKKDKSAPQEGDILEFIVLDLLRDKQKVVISHTMTFSSRVAGREKPIAERFVKVGTKTTLGDFGALDKLQEKIEREEKKK